MNLYSRITAFDTDRCLTDGEHFAICPDCGFNRLCVFCDDACPDCQTGLWS